MPAKSIITLEDLNICNDLAKGELTIQEIAAKYNKSASNVYKLARGDVRPEIKRAIDDIIEGELAMARRLAKMRGYWFMQRLIQLAQGTQVVKPATENSPEVVEIVDSKTSLGAVIKGLEIAGLASVTDSDDSQKRTIEIVFSGGNNGKLPRKRLTGVFRPTGKESEAANVDGHSDIVGDNGNDNVSSQ
jgi:hypothetical protein